MADQRRDDSGPGRVPGGRAVLGMDVGGTKTRALVRAADGAVLADVTTASASLQAVPDEVAGERLRELVRQLGESVVAQVGAVVVGSAGLDTPELVARMTALVQQALPDADVTVVHDTRLLLAAAGLTSGCVVIFGTGSSAWALSPDGASARTGGWGWLLGDEGSGFGIVREAVRRALDDLDHDRPQSLLTTRLLEAVAQDQPDVKAPVDLIGAVHGRPGSGVWAGYAPAVVAALREGCPVAREVVDLGVDAGAQATVLACRRAGVAGPVVLAGGLAMGVDEVADGLRSRLEGAGLRDVRALERDPVHGAVDLARARAGHAEPGHAPGHAGPGHTGAGHAGTGNAEPGESADA